MSLSIETLALAKKSSSATKKTIIDLKTQINDFTFVQDEDGDAGFILPGTSDIIYFDKKIMPTFVMLEYIESNSRQYMPTDIYITAEDTIECDIQVTDVARQNYEGVNMFFDTDITTENGLVLLFMQQANRACQASNGQINVAFLPSFSDEFILTRHLYKIDNLGKIYIDEVDQNRQIAGETVSLPLTFFGRQVDGQQDLTSAYYGRNNRQSWSAIRFYGCTITRNGEIIHNLKPAFNELKKECCLIDLVTNKEYYNQDTSDTKADFLHPEIPKEA